MINDSSLTRHCTQLIEKLDQGLSHRLTLLIAPRGSGKSRLLTRWTELPHVHAVTLRLNDQHPSANSIIRQICQSCPVLQETIWNLDSPEAEIVALINWLSDIPKNLSIVLNEYQSSPESDALLNMLITYLPPLVHVYIASESIPAIPAIPRMRVRRQILELTAMDFESPPADLR